MNGIDISIYQQNIDLRNIDKNIKYVYIKATEGVNFVDKAFHKNTQNAKESGLKYGFYHFMSEATEPSQQAIDFYNAIKQYDYSLIPVLDIENNTKGRTKTQVTDRVLQFLNKFKELSGIDCIIYTYTSFESAYLDSRVANYKCWIANYNGGNSYPNPIIFKSYVGHQYSGTGTIQGYNGQIDVNNFTSAIELSNGSVSGNVVPIQANANVVSTTSVDYSKYSNYIINQGHSVLDIQKLLNNKGYKLVCDGIMGTNTLNAIKDFQAKRGLWVDGLVGKDTYNKLIETVSSKGNQWTAKVQAILGVTEDGIVGEQTLSVTPTLKVGSQGQLVKLLQERLNSYGFNCGIADGIFGNATKQALYNYQVNRKLLADGICGKQTWKQLML